MQIFSPPLSSPLLRFSVVCARFGVFTSWYYYFRPCRALVACLHGWRVHTPAIGPKIAAARRPGLYVRMCAFFEPACPRAAVNFPVCPYDAVGFERTCACICSRMRDTRQAAYGLRSRGPTPILSCRRVILNFDNGCEKESRCPFFLAGEIGSIQ